MFTPNYAIIDVVLTPVTPSKEWPHGVKFALVSNLLCDGRLVFHNNGKPGFKLNFRIVDEGTGYLFPHDETKAMWVKRVENLEEKCPESAMHWPKFRAKDVSDDYKNLRVFNKNDKDELFMFTLLFTKTPEQNGPCIEYDPIGDNRNGYSLAPVAALATGAAVVSLALAVTAFFRQRKR